MQSFEAVKRYLSFLGLLSSESEPLKKKIRDVLMNFSILFLLTICTCVPSINIMFTTEDVEILAYALLQIVFFMFAFASYVSMAANKQKIMKIFNLLQSIQAEHNDHFQKHFEKLEKKCTMLFDYGFMMMVIGAEVVLICFTSISAISDLLSNEFNPREWNVVFRMNFEPILLVEKPWHFAIIIFCQLFGALLFLATPFALSVFFLTIYLYIDCLTEMYELMLNENDGIVVAGLIQEVRIKGKLKTIVKFHIDIIAVFDELSDLLDGPIFSQILSGALNFALSIYLMDMSIKPGAIDYNQLATMILEFSVTTSVTFGFCYVSSRMSEKLINLGDVAYHSMWYRYPVSCQKYILTLIAYAQKPRYLSGFGIVLCTLSVFSKIVRTSFQYYLALKGLSSR